MATEQEQKNIDAIREEIKSTIVSHTKTDDGELVKQEEKEVKEPDNDEEVEVKEEEVEEESVEKLKKTIEKLQRRIGKTTAEKKQIAKDLELAKSKLVDEGKENVLTEEDVEARAEEKANQKLIEKQLRASSDKLFDDAVKIDKNFQIKLDAMVEETGAFPAVMIGILDDLGNGGAILNHLTDNTDEAEKIFGLSPAKMAVELSKISVKIKPKPKQISKVPDPPSKQLGGKSARDLNVMPDPKDTDAWIKWRNKQIAEERANGKTGLR